jgi:hypothetical protein
MHAWTHISTSLIEEALWLLSLFCPLHRKAFDLVPIAVRLRASLSADGSAGWMVTGVECGRDAVSDR